MGGGAAAFVWLALWAIVLRLFGIPAFQRSPEERATRRERIVAMGKWRYVFIFGMFGSGLGFGIGIVVANTIAMPHITGWTHAATQLVLSMVFLGFWNGVTGWNQFRGEVPFPPYYPPQK